ncbi:hypothetical protein [Natrinema sp. SYSU A 869]|uniref:hypothetical protein n=1 Tax=Natrinema sp. SYSU A 869 TaxID=2871694 RepID=UPI001CA3A475|nr:hypothetical protein [Natrinema sp. SYSU A 869]
MDDGWTFTAIDLLAEFVTQFEVVGEAESSSEFSIIYEQTTGDGDRIGIYGNVTGYGTTTYLSQPTLIAFGPTETMDCGPRRPLCDESN